MPGQYDEDAYYCLVIAILTGVGSATARKIYECRQSNPNAKNEFVMDQYKFKLESEEKEERKVQIKRMRNTGLSLEAVAELLGCDCSTVKRDLKKED